MLPDVLYAASSYLRHDDRVHATDSVGSDAAFVFIVFDASDICRSETLLPALYEQIRAGQ